MSAQHPPDIVELQLRLAQDDQTALKSLYDHFGGRLFHLAVSIIRSREIAEEIVEDVFVQVWNKRQRISSLENLTWYLFITTRNISFSYYRKHKGEKLVDLSEVAAGYYQICATPEQVMIGREDVILINQAINELPDQCRMIFKLVKEDNFRYQEVADLMQIRIKTVENQVGIALKKLYTAIRRHSPQSVKFFR